MDALLASFFAGPMYYIGAFFAFFAAIGFLIFLSGVGSGVGNIFHMHGNDEHLTHARVRGVWGIYILVFLFLLWEVVRWVGALFSGAELPNTSFVVTLVAIVLLVFAWQWVGKNLGGGGGGH